MKKTKKRRRNPLTSIPRQQLQNIIDQSIGALIGEALSSKNLNVVLRVKPTITAEQLAAALDGIEIEITWHDKTVVIPLHQLKSAGWPS